MTISVAYWSPPQQLSLAALHMPSEGLGLVGVLYDQLYFRHSVCMCSKSLKLIAASFWKH